MRKAFVLSIALLLAALPLFAQPTATKNSLGQALPPDAPSREQLLKLFEMLEIRKQMDSMRDTLTKTLQQQFAQMSRGQLSPKQQDEFGKLEGELLGKLMSGEVVANMVDELIPIYQRHFNSSDVDALIGFYSTTAGQKFLHEQSTIMAEYMPKAMENMQGKVQQAMEETHFTERVEQIMHEGENTAPASPKKPSQNTTPQKPQGKKPS
ncbi:MAG TPA: DUF2059 domain-containing protein [Candidatus Angelobacter sp.]|jgi:hypothetical protein|nr:DUF2059 domain-containing protein [Candidatus Angelobacter sp.]